MIKLSLMYPNQDGNTFDMDYYCTKHMLLVRQLVGLSLLNLAVDEGSACFPPGSPAPYLAVGHLYSDSVATFQQAFAPHIPQLLADIPNFTNAQPAIQLSNVKL